MTKFLTVLFAAAVALSLSLPAAALQDSNKQETTKQEKKEHKKHHRHHKKDKDNKEKKDDKKPS